MNRLFRMVAGLPMSAAVLSVVLFAAAPAHASTIYTYTGNLFTEAGVTGTSTVLPADPYTTADRITGFIELADPLAANLSSLTTMAPLTFSFFDGVNTITHETAGLSQFRVTTDAAGNIVNWSVFVQIFAPGATGGGTSQTISTDNYVSMFGPTIGNLVISDFGDDALCGPGSSGGCAYSGVPFYNQTGRNRDAAGTWRLQTASVPEPTSTLLLGAALVGFALRRRQA